MPRLEGTQLVPGRFYPALTIDLLIGGRRGTGLAIVDSGADQTMLPAEFVAGAGLPFDGLPAMPGKNVGAGGDDPRTCKGELGYSGVVFCTEFAVAEPGKLPFAILGREDFFKFFTIRFAWPRVPPTFDVDPLVIAAKKRGGRP